MKTCQLLVALMFLFLANLALSEEEAADPSAGYSDEQIRKKLLDGLRSNVGIFTEFVEIDQARLAALLLGHAKQSDAEWLRSELGELEKAGKAKVVESSYLVTRSGQRAKVQAVREWIYPTEWDPPEVPQKLEGPIDRDVVIKAPNTPTAFEMRPVGCTIEVDPVIDANGKTIQLNFAPELVEFSGNRENGQAEATNLIPVFLTQKSSTSFHLVDGHAELFSVTSRSGTETDKSVLGFVTAKLIRPITQVDLKRLEKSPRKYLEEKYGTDYLAQEKRGQLATQDNPFAAPPKNELRPTNQQKGSNQLSVLVEFIETDVAQAHRLIDGMGTSSDVSPDRRRLDKLIAKGDAKLVGSSFVIGRSGQRFKSESIREWIYPTEMDPPQIPQELRGPIEQGVDLMTPLSSTAFEMRPVGVSVEMDPVIGSDNETIEINFAPELVRLADQLTYGRSAAEATQPLFETFKVTSATSMPNGSVFLHGMGGFESARAGEAAAVEEQDQARGRRILIFVTPTIRNSP